MENKTISFIVSDEFALAIRIAAAKLNMTRSALIRAAVRKYLAELERNAPKDE